MKTNRHYIFTLIVLQLIKREICLAATLRLRHFHTYVTSSCAINPPKNTTFVVIDHMKFSKEGGSKNLLDLLNGTYQKKSKNFQDEWPNGYMETFK